MATEYTDEELVVKMQQVASAEIEELREMFPTANPCRLLFLQATKVKDQVTGAELVIEIPSISRPWEVVIRRA